MEPAVCKIVQVEVIVVVSLCARSRPILSQNRFGCISESLYITLKLKLCRPRLFLFQCTRSLGPMILSDRWKTLHYKMENGRHCINTLMVMLFRCARSRRPILLPDRWKTRLVFVHTPQISSSHLH